eukprot:TCONS_00052166-protein
MPRKGDKRKRRSDDESSSGASTSKNAKNTKKEETPAIEEVTTIPAVFTKSGKVLAFGQGDVGQLGLGDEVLERKRPALVKEVDDIKFIQSVCGGMHTVILTEDGEVYTFGCNDEGALGRATSGTDDEEYYARKVALPDGVKIIQVSAGDSHTAALSDKGEVYAWGAYRDASGQMGLTAASLGKKNEIRKIYPKGDEIEDPAIKVASGNDHTVILTKDGSIYTNGTGEQGQLGRLKECFGHRGGRRGLDFLLSPQLVRFRRKVRFSDIFTGSFCTFALSSDTNDVYAWGLNNYGQLGSGTNDNYFNPKVIKPLTEIRNQSKSNQMVIQGGQHHSIMVDGEGIVYSFGRAEYGRLGLGTDAKETAVPVKVPKLADKKVKDVACGESVSYAVTEKGQLYSWGFGTTLQLGVGDDDDIYEPELVKSKNLDPETDEVLTISGGGQHVSLVVCKKENTANGHES